MQLAPRKIWRGSFVKVDQNPPLFFNFLQFFSIFILKTSFLKGERAQNGGENLSQKLGEARGQSCTQF